MNGSRLTAVCLAALAVALPASGCGGDDSDQFREDYNAAVERLSSINSDTAEQTRSDLAELDPPDDAKEEFDALLASLEQGVDDLRAVASAAKSDNPAEANEAVRDLARTGKEITEAENALKKAVDG